MGEMWLFARHTDDGADSISQNGGPPFVAAPDVPYHLHTVVVILVYGPYEDQREIGRWEVGVWLEKAHDVPLPVVGLRPSTSPNDGAGSWFQSFGRLDPKRKMRVADPQP